MRLNHSSSGDTHFWALESDQTSVSLLCVQPARQCFYFVLFFPFPSSPQSLSFHPTALYFERRQKGTKTHTQKNVTIKGSWCLDCTPGVLTAEQSGVTTLRRTFTFPFCRRFPSVCRCHPASLCVSVSSLSSFSHHLVFSFLYLLSALWVSSPCTHAQIVLYSDATRWFSHSQWACYQTH